MSECDFEEFCGQNVISGNLGLKCDFGKIWGQNVILWNFGFEI